MKRLFPSRWYSSGRQWSLWRWTDVAPIEGHNIYMTRLHLIQTPWGSIMLHWIMDADNQPHCHDHPVGFLSFLLKGTYAEDVPDSQAWDGHRPATYLVKVRVVRWVNFKRAADRHRIISLRGNPYVLTLVFAGPKVREWGFHTTLHGWIYWRDYVSYRKMSGKWPT